MSFKIGHQKWLYSCCWHYSDMIRVDINKRNLILMISERLRTVHLSIFPRIW